MIMYTMEDIIRVNWPHYCDPSTVEGRQWAENIAEIAAEVLVRVWGFREISLE
jgi:hypothetical protein